MSIKKEDIEISFEVYCSKCRSDLDFTVTKYIAPANRFGIKVRPCKCLLEAK